MSIQLFHDLRETIFRLDVSKINADRKAVLQSLIQYVQHKKAANEPIQLNFICTHNSRRSHLSQVWAQTMAAHFEVQNVFCYSGGTEATAMFPMIAKTLKQSGFELLVIAEGTNPIYSIKFAETAPPIIGFSKTFDHDFNPQSKFAAVMVCSEAEENCPFIANAEKRMAVTYEDPKAYDDTPQQAEKYDERSMQIATEMYYIFSNIS